MFGWTGKILRINLSNGAVTTTETEEYFDFLGGKGINTAILFEEVPPETQPFDPDNRLIFGTGPLVGTLAPSSGRCSLTTKSPLTGIFGDTNLGSHWGAGIKHAGYDGLVVHGRASEPIHLWINDEIVEIRSAKHLWGKDTWEAQQIIAEEIGNPRLKSVCIGPAGENLVRFSCVVTEMSNAGARTGAGAVMGSKQLKAISVSGTKGVKIAKPDQFSELCEKVHDSIKNSPMWVSIGRSMADAFRMYNSSGTITYGYHEAAVPPEFGMNRFPEEMEKFNASAKIRNIGCFGCPLRCQSLHHVSGVGSAKLTCESWQQCMTFSKVLDFKFGLQCYILLQKYGLDVFSTASTIGFIIELFKRGLITKEETDGIELDFGDKDLFLDLIEKTARREGIGDLIAEGSYRAAKKIGKEAEEIACTVKKLELPNYSFYEPGYALGAAGSERGGWLRSYGLPITFAATYPDEGRPLLKHLMATDELPDVGYEWMPRVLTYFEHVEGAADLVGICKWITTWMTGMPVNLNTMARMLTLATGRDIDEKELELYVDRQKNTARAFNIREGIERKDDEPPLKYFHTPKETDPHKGVVLDRKKYNAMLTEYYRLKGWHVHTGVPTGKTLHRIGLEFVAEDLKERGFLV